MYRVLAVRLYPTALQGTGLEAHLLACRRLYNAAVEERINAWKHRSTRIGRFEQQRQLPALRRELPELAAVSSIVLQDVILRVDRAFRQYYRGVTGHPRFRRASGYRSLTYSAHRPGNYTLAGPVIKFAKIGAIRARLKSFPAWRDKASPKSCTIKKVAGRWYAFVRFRLEPTSSPPIRNDVLGIDVGIESFLTTSEGQHFPNIRAYSRSEKALRRAQRIFDRRKLGGTNREKARIRIARIYERAKNRRLDQHHQVSRRIANRFAWVAAENNLTGLHRGWLAKQVYDVGWSQFLRILGYKLAERGGALLRVDGRGTSQRCSRCDTTVRKTLAERTHTCIACGLVLHRDVNAAINIRKLAKLPAERGEVTPAEIGGYRASGPVPVVDAGT